MEEKWAQLIPTIAQGLITQQSEEGEKSFIQLIKLLLTACRLHRTIVDLLRPMMDTSLLHHIQRLSNKNVSDISLGDCSALIKWARDKRAHLIKRNVTTDQQEPAAVVDTTV